MRVLIPTPTTGSLTKENTVLAHMVVTVSVPNVFWPGCVTDSLSETVPCIHVSAVDVSHDL